MTWVKIRDKDMQLYHFLKLTVEMRATHRGPRSCLNTGKENTYNWWLEQTQPWGGMLGGGGGIPILSSHPFGGPPDVKKSGLKVMHASLNILF